MTQVDYSVVDMPSMLSRSVLKQAKNDPTKWVRDDAWYDDIKAIYGTLLKFFEDNGLLAKPLWCSHLDEVVIRFNDLSDLGKSFVRSGADEKWLASFDRPGSKKSNDDVSYLQRALERLADDG